MKKFNILLVVLIMLLLFSFTGCEDKEKLLKEVIYKEHIETIAGQLIQEPHLNGYILKMKKKTVAVIKENNGVLEETGYFDYKTTNVDGYLTYNNYLIEASSDDDHETLTVKIFDTNSDDFILSFKPAREFRVFGKSTRIEILGSRLCAVTFINSTVLSEKGNVNRQNCEDSLNNTAPVKNYETNGFDTRGYFMLSLDLNNVKGTATAAYFTGLYPKHQFLIDENSIYTLFFLDKDEAKDKKYIIFKHSLATLEQTAKLEVNKVINIHLYNQSLYVLTDTTGLFNSNYTLTSYDSSLNKLTKTGISTTNNFTFNQDKLILSPFIYYDLSDPKNLIRKESDTPTENIRFTIEDKYICIIEPEHKITITDLNQNVLLNFNTALTLIPSAVHFDGETNTFSFICKKTDNLNSQFFGYSYSVVNKEAVIIAEISLYKYSNEITDDENETLEISSYYYSNGRFFVLRNEYVDIYDAHFNLQSRLDLQRYHTVFFDTDGGTVVEPLIVIEGSKLTREFLDNINCTKNGFILSYWHEINGLKVYNIKSDLYLKAIWVEAGGGL